MESSPDMLSGAADLLKVGFAGFAALMSMLCFWLLRQLISRTDLKIPKNVLDAVKSFARYTFALATLVIVSDLLVQVVNYQREAMRIRTTALTTQAQDCADAIAALGGEEAGRAETVDQLRQVYDRSHVSCHALMQTLVDLDQ